MPFTCGESPDRGSWTSAVKRLLALAVCATAAPSVPAAELVVRDLQLSLSVLPSGFSYALTSPTVSGAGDDSFASGTELSFGGRYALARPGDSLGLVLGGDLITDAWTYAGGGSLVANGLRASAGLGWAMSDGWTLLLEPGIRYGMSTFDLPASAIAPDYSATGSFSGYDARVTALWRMSDGLLLEGHGGWLSVQHSATSGDIEQTIDQSGLYVGIGMVWRWSSAPPRIE